jgi:DNA-binding NtrC family response regulator
VRDGHRVLVVDDEPGARAALAEVLRVEGYTVAVAADGFKALPKIAAIAPEVVVCDLRMPGMDGLELTRRVLADDPDRIVILMTAFGSVDQAIAALRAGAVDFLTKPVDVDHLLEVIARELDRRQARHEASELQRRLAERRSLANLVGGSEAMRHVADLVQQVAPSRATVLITGESGTGKELVAEALHALSPRAARPLIKLHCAALAESVLESELFGHERGAFTGAFNRRDGRFEQASGGTLFLDEISEISLATQVKLLRALQERAVERVGGTETIHVDVRVVAATNRDLRQMVAEQRFREDLYYRLYVVPIHLPPLRERLDDVPALAEHFLRKYVAENGRAITGFTDEAIDALCRYRWPGNVRELENAIERAVVICRGAVVDVADLALSPEDPVPDVPPIPGSTMADLERDAILRTLEHAGGSTSRAASILGVSARMIQYRLSAYGLGAGGRRHGR